MGVGGDEAGVVDRNRNNICTFVYVSGTVFSSGFESEGSERMMTYMDRT